MATFTSTKDLNIRWLGNDISGAAGATHRIPDALQDEFDAAFADRIPGLTWVEDDEIGAAPTAADVAGKYDKTGGIISGAVTATGAFVGQTSVSTPSLTATNARFKGGPWYDVKAYGATGDGTTDDAAAIQAALDAVPVGFNGSGGVVYFPPGNYRISTPVIVKSRGTRLQGAAGAYGAVINPLTGFAIGSAPVLAALVLQMSDSAHPYGTGIENLNIRLDSASTAHGIVWYQSGDVSHMTNIWVMGVGSTASGIRVIVDPQITLSNDISDTIVWTNVFVQTSSNSGSGRLVYLQRCQEMTLVGCKFIGGDGSAVTTGQTRVGLFIDTPRGITLLGCSTSSFGEHVRIENNHVSASTTVGFVNFVGHTFENGLTSGSGGRMIVTSGASARLLGIHVVAPRYYNDNGASIQMVDTDLSEINAKHIPISLNSACSQNIVQTSVRSGVTDSGTLNTILGYDDAKLTVAGIRIASRIQTVRTTTSNLSAGASEDLTLTWPTAFSSTNYTFTVLGRNTSAAANTIKIQGLSKAAGNVVMRITNGDSVARIISVEAIAIDD